MAKTGLKTVFHGEDVEAVTAGSGVEPDASAEVIMAVPAVSSPAVPPMSRNSGLPTNLYITKAEFPFVRKWTKKPQMPPRPIPTENIEIEPVSVVIEEDTSKVINHDHLADGEKAMEERVSLMAMWEKVDTDFYNLPGLTPESAKSMDIGGLVAWSVS